MLNETLLDDSGSYQDYQAEPTMFLCRKMRLLLKGSSLPFSEYVEECERAESKILLALSQQDHDYQSLSRSAWWYESQHDQDDDEE
jgi:hypothetical protein